LATLRDWVRTPALADALIFSPLKPGVLTFVPEGGLRPTPPLNLARETAAAGLRRLAAAARAERARQDSLAKAAGFRRAKKRRQSMQFEWLRRYHFEGESYDQIAGLLTPVPKKRRPHAAAAGPRPVRKPSDRSEKYTTRHATSTVRKAVQRLATDLGLLLRSEP
jgi:hypothetical protein